MRFDGKLSSWNDERGFGFIEPVQGGQEIFVHIKSFPPGSGRRWPVSPWVAAAYVISSLAAFVAYAVDKSAARAGRWRTREATLHWFSMACGWPGALLAQQLLRHKTSKSSFVAGFWATVAVNIGAFVLLHSPAGRGLFA